MSAGGGGGYFGGGAGYVRMFLLLYSILVYSVVFHSV